MYARMMVAVAVGVLWTAPAAAQGTFEGMVTSRMSSGEGRPTVLLRTYQMGSKVRQEYDTPQGTMASIIDGKTGEMMTIMAAQKKYMVINMRDAVKTMAPAVKGMQPTAADVAKYKVTPTGKRETIAGVSCEHYKFSSADRPGADLDICGATGMGFMGSPDGNGMSGMGMPNTADMLKGNPALASLAAKGFFPLKMTMSDRDRTSVFEATALERRRP